MGPSTGGLTTVNLKMDKTLLRAPTRPKSRLKCGACGAMPICEMKMAIALYPKISLDLRIWMETSQSGTSTPVISPHLKILKFNLCRTMLWLFLSAFCSPWLLCCFKRRQPLLRILWLGYYLNTLPPPNLGSYPHTLHFVYSSPSIVLFMCI